jgi:hypothetical protein
MVTWRIVDDDVECLHVERNPTMTCSGSHLSDTKDITWQYSFVNSSIKYMKACYFVESESF